jgi:hypothetical protein
MRTKLKDRLLDWLSQGQQIGLKASWPAQSQLKGRVERLASKEKKGEVLLLGQSFYYPSCSLPY